MQLNNGWPPLLVNWSRPRSEAPSTPVILVWTKLKSPRGCGQRKVGVNAPFVICSCHVNCIWNVNAWSCFYLTAFHSGQITPQEPRLSNLWMMISGSNLSQMIWAPILTLQQETFGSHAGLWKAPYVRMEQHLSSLSQHHAAICWSNMTQNPISHSPISQWLTVWEFLPPSLSLSFPLPCFIFPFLALAL